jgi:6-phosphogluconolactonase (cycloisomerase 2 family)
LAVALVTSLQAQFAYVVNSGDNTVSAYSIGSNGALTPVPGSPFAVMGLPAPVSVAVDPTGKFAYVANAGANTVSAYSIGSNGALAPIPDSASTPANVPVSVAVDATGKFAYVANQDSRGGHRPAGTVSAFSVGSNGALTPIPGSLVAARGELNSVAVDPTGKFVYAAGDNTVSAYSIDSNGVLTPVPGSPFAALGSHSMAVDPTGKFVYAAGDNAVSAYGIDSNGALTPVPGSPFAALGSNSVAVDPTGKFVYAAGGNNTLWAYSIGSKGALTPVPGSPFAEPGGPPNGSFPKSVAVDPTGKFAYVANFNSDDVLAYSIAPNGTLTPIARSLSGHKPISVAITPLAALHHR